MNCDLVLCVLLFQTCWLGVQRMGSPWTSVCFLFCCDARGASVDQFGDYLCQDLEVSRSGASVFQPNEEVQRIVIVHCFLDRVVSHAPFAMNGADRCRR